MARRTPLRLATLAGIASICLTGLAVVAAPPAAVGITVGSQEHAWWLNEYRNIAVRVYADRPISTEPIVTNLGYAGTGRASWTNQEFSDRRGPASPLYRVALDRKVPFRSSVILSNLSATSGVRAALDGVSGDIPADGCAGGTATERAAISAFVWNGSSWIPGAGVLDEHEGEGNGTGCGYLGLSRPEVGWNQVMFVVDLYCRDTLDNGVDECDSVSGKVPGGTRLSIEIEGSGDGVYNSGFADSTSIPATVSDVAGPINGSSTLSVSAEAHGLAPGERFTIESFDAACRARSITVLASPAPTPDGFSGRIAGCTPVTGPTSLRKIGPSNRHYFPGDAQFEVMLGTDRVERFDPGSGEMVNGLTNDRDEFLNRIGNAFEEWTGLMTVPACDDGGPDPDRGPCLQSAGAGWELMMIDGPNGITLRPWRSEAPYYVTPSSTVSYQLRMPASDEGKPFRSYVLGPDITGGFSILSSSAMIDSFTYTEEGDHHVLSLGLTAALSTTVNLFGGEFNELFFEDRCRSMLAVGLDRIPYVESNGTPGRQSDEDTANCDSEASGMTLVDAALVRNSALVDRVSLWGDPDGDADRAWLRLQFNVHEQLVVGDTVTVCCAYGAFDGRHTVVAVGNPYLGVIDTTPGAGLSNTEGRRWFALSTAANPEYNDKSFPIDEGSTDPSWEPANATVVRRDFIRVTSTSITLDVDAQQPYPFDPDADDNNDFLAGSYISTNAQAVAQGPAVLDPTQRVFDFALAGSSRTSSGSPTSGFFRVCLPATFLAEKWGGASPAAVVARLSSRQASSVGTRNAGLSVSAATCGTPGGVLAVLPRFGFSAPYFVIDPDAPLADSGTPPVESGSSGGPSCGAPPLPSCGLPAGIVLGPGGTIQNPGALSAADVENLRPENMTGFRPADVRALNPDALRNFRPDLIASMPSQAMRALDPARLAALPPAALSAFDAAKVAAMPPAAMAGLSADQVAALPPAALGSIRFTQVAAMPPSAVQGLTADRVAALPPSAIQGFGRAQIAALSPQSITGLAPAQVAALAPAMARALAPAQVMALPPQSIASMTPGAFKALSTEALASLTPAQRTALPAEALDPPVLARPATSSTISSLVGSISGWNVDQVPPSAFGGLRPSDVSRMAIDTFTALAPAQLAAVPPRALSALAPAQAALLPPEALASLRPAQVAALPPQVVGAMSPAQVAALPRRAVASLRPSQAAQLPVAAIEALGTDQVAALPRGAIASLDAPQVSALQPAAISALTAQQVAALRPAALGGLEPEQAAALPESALRRITGAQLGGLTPSAFGGLGAQQLAALPASAFRGLTTDQAAALTGEQSLALAPADLRSMPAAVRAIVLQRRAQGTG